MIEVDGLEVSFGARRVLDGLTFRVGDGEVVGLLAANGGGKTTCFRTIAGGIRPGGGRVVLDGVVQHTGGRRIPVSYASAERVAWPRRTPRSVLRMIAGLHGIRRRDADGRIDSLSRRLGMDAILDVRSASSSTGEAMKLTLARILLAPVRNVVLDEPTAGLDHATADAVAREVDALRDAGHAILISSHRREDIDRMAGRVVHVEAGRVVPPAADRHPTAALEPAA